VRKSALLFVLAVLVPSLALAWVAFHSLRNQELILAKQRDLLYEGLATSLTKDVIEIVGQQQTLFAQKVEMLLGNIAVSEAAERFDKYMEKMLPLAKAAFSVSIDGKMFSPSLLGEPAARRFRLEYERFLTSRETAQVYWEGPKGPINLSALDAESEKGFGKPPPKAAEAEFRQLVGDKTQGTVARFDQNQMRLLFWYRPPRQSDLIFGIEVNLRRLGELFTNVVKVSKEQVASEACLALLNENFEPVALSRSAFSTDWRQPFEAVDIGDILPYWKIAVYLTNPAQLVRAADTLRLSLSVLIALAIVSIAAGGWFVFRDVERKVRQARLRTDFVSNVSHELKTPLTSIRMFSELLADGRVQDPAKERDFLRIIVTESARLTRLINNVLDFSRHERGEKRYDLQKIDLLEVLRNTVEAYRPHLERNGFSVQTLLPSEPLIVQADRDAIAQVLLNLLSNAEKYSAERKEVRVSVATLSGKVRVMVEDRGRGVPKGCGEKIFEQFFRAHDSLAEPISGAGLGLTLARNIIEAHHGRLWYEPRDVGGSRFIIELPL
jgi:signal transduction histidine kinase